MLDCLSQQQSRWILYVTVMLVKILQVGSRFSSAEAPRCPFDTTSSNREVNIREDTYLCTYMNIHVLEHKPLLCETIDNCDNSMGLGTKDYALRKGFDTRIHNYSRAHEPYAVVFISWISLGLFNSPQLQGLPIVYKY